jgi:hypothetical protein
MKILVLALVILITLPSSTFAKSCGAMIKELEQLRAEYLEYANGGVNKSDAVTFEGLCEILDKIIESKNAISKACPRTKIPPRKRKDWTETNQRRRP